MDDAVYATTGDLKSYAFQMGRGDDLRHEEVVPRASRIIDQRCGVPVNFFAVAKDSATTKILRSSGTNLLRMPPYVCGSILNAEYTKGFVFFPEYEEILDSNGVQWLSGNRCFEYFGNIEITARWGWERVPADIVEATIELSIAIWRQRDAAFLSVVDAVNGGGISGQAVPDRVKMICDEWRKKRELVFA